MNLLKVSAALVIVLSLSTSNVEGGIGLLLLLKALALKGAAFTLVGIPLALGSFILGQGAGFFGGSLFGGLGALKLTVKYLNNRARHAYYKGVYGHGHYYHHNPHYLTGSNFWRHFGGSHIPQWSDHTTIWSKASNVPGNLTGLKKPNTWKNSPGWYRNPIFSETRDSIKYSRLGGKNGPGSIRAKPLPLAGFKSSPYKGHKRNNQGSFDNIELPSHEFYERIPAPNAFLEKFLEKKLQEQIQTQQSESNRRDAAQLIQLLREVYIQELSGSLDTSADTKQNRRQSTNGIPGIPAFKPFPSIPNSTMEYELPEAASSVAWSVVPPSFGNPFPSFGSTEEFIPGRTSYNLEKRLGYAWDSTSEDMPFDLTNEHPPIEEPGVLPSSQALTAFVDDMKKFFLLVSLLDYDGCLQKVVCDVHCKGPEESLTTYESNIILTFELMNSILPMNEEDSTTKFRKASKIGELTKNTQLCAKAYPSCTYSTEEIIKMGNLASAEENVSDTNHLLPATEPMNVNTAAPEDKDRSDQVPSAVTAMPRV